MTVQAQILIDIRRNQQLHHCTCGRYLYVKD
jgi:predicted  nucleic acid-binding Zn-ribbon protein